MNNALAVLRILKKYSSEDHCLTAQEINERIGEEWTGVALDRKTIYKAIDDLNAYGKATGEFDIIAQGRKGYYYRQTSLSSSDIRQIIESIKQNGDYTEKDMWHLVKAFLGIATPTSRQEDLFNKETKSLPAKKKGNHPSDVGLLSRVADMRDRREVGIFALDKKAKGRMTLGCPFRDFHDLLLAPVDIKQSQDEITDVGKASITFYYDYGRYQSEYYEFSVPLSYIRSVEPGESDNAEGYYRSYERRRRNRDLPDCGQLDPLGGLFYITQPTKIEGEVSPYFRDGFMLLRYEGADEDVDYIDPTLPLNERLSLQLTPGEMDSLSTSEGLMGFISSIEKSDRQDRPYVTSRLILLSRLAYLASSRRRFNEPDGYLEALLQTTKHLTHPSYYKAMFSSMVNATKTMPSNWDYGSLCNKGKGGLPSPEIRIDRGLLPRLVSDNMDRLLPALFLLKYLLREIVSKEREAGAELSLFDTIAANIGLHFRREDALLPLRRILEYAVESKSKANLSSLSLEQVYGVFEKLYADWQ